MGHGCLTFDDARREGFYTHNLRQRDKYFYGSRTQKKWVKAKENGGDVLPATDPRGDVAKRAVSEKEVKIH